MAPPFVLQPPSPLLTALAARIFPDANGHSGNQFCCNSSALIPLHCKARSDWCKKKMKAMLVSFSRTSTWLCSEMSGSRLQQTEARNMTARSGSWRWRRLLHASLVSLALEAHVDSGTLGYWGGETDRQQDDSAFWRRSFSFPIVAPSSLDFELYLEYQRGVWPRPGPSLWWLVDRWMPHQPSPAFSARRCAARPMAAVYAVEGDGWETAA